jgi:hypothetical protein
MTDENTPQPTETSKLPAAQLEERGGVLEIVDQVSTIVGGLGGAAAGAYAIKHWNDPAGEPASR